MGRPKHGTASARTKSSAKYKAEGRRTINKKIKSEKISIGKKIKSCRVPKSNLMKWNILILNTPQNKPYCDPVDGVVYWGTNRDDSSAKEKRSKRKGVK